MEARSEMIWVIVVLIIGFALIIIYRLYCYPPLSKTAKQQQQKFIQAFREEKDLIYQMPAQELIQFQQTLKRHFSDAGRGCFYGPTLMIHLSSMDSQVTIQVFSDSPQNLTRAVWKVLSCKPQVGGMHNPVAHG
jgi:hypothetical protein